MDEDSKLWQALEAADVDIDVAAALNDTEDSESALTDVRGAIHDIESDLPSNSEVVSKVAEYFTTFVGDVASPEPILENVDPNLRVDNIEEILEYHFLRTGRSHDGSGRDEFELSPAVAATETSTGVQVGVRDFVSMLDNRLRQIRTQVDETLELSRGGVRGRIDWQETVRHRYSGRDPTETEYVTRVRRPDVLSVENRVLLTLLTGIRETYERYEKRYTNSDGRAGWLPDWAPGEPLRESVERALAGPHFEGVDSESISVSQREIAAVHDDRAPLYREAAALLEQYRGLDPEKLSKSDAESLFGMDVFEPDEDSDGESTVFELYWIFRLIEEFQADGFEPLDLDPEQDFIAAWQESGTEYRLYNDWKGEDNGTVYIRFPGLASDATANSNNDVTRAGYVHQAHRTVRESAFEEDVRHNNGTPDIVLLALDASEPEPMLTGVFIGEVKRTDRKLTALSGLKQLLDYGALARVGRGADVSSDSTREYITTTPWFFDDDVLELGLYVGSQSLYDDDDTPEVEVCGYGDDPEPPLID